MLALLVSALLLAPSRASAEVIDRIIATVNGRVILQSDWDEALCYEALLTNRTLAQFTDDDRRAVLDRLIDQELLARADEVRRLPPRHRRRGRRPRRRGPQAISSGRIQRGLAGSSRQYHLTEKDLLAHVRQQIDVMRLVDARLRPAVQIDSKSIEAYYRDQFVPKLKQSGASEVPLADVSAKIRELLTEQKVSELLVSWLQTLRSEGQVHIPGVTSSANDPGVQSQ